MIHEHRSTDAAGRPVLVRRGDDDGDRARLRHEARMLELARHPGVVEIVSSDPDGAGLVLSLPSTETLTSLATQPGLALEVLAAAGETLADLHGLGIVHAGLTAEAILVGPDRRPTLARFDRAGEAGDAVDGGDALRPSDDVAALAKLVTATLTGRGGSRPRRGAAAGAHRGREGGELTRLLRATSEGRIPTARRLARAIEDELPDRLVQAPLPRRHPDETSSAQGEAPPEDGPAPAPDHFARLRPTDAPASRRRAPRVLTVAAAVAGVAAIIWGGLSLAAGSAVERAPGRSRPLLAPVAGPTTIAIMASDGTRPAAQAVVAHEGLVTIGGTRYQVGAPGDDVVAGDWGCRGAVRALVLRPASGELFAFTGWATVGHDLTGTAAGRVAPGSHLATATDAHGCLLADAVAPDGRSMRVDPGQA